MIERRLADISGPFFTPKKPFRNWSSFPFYQTDLPTAPYVDTRQLAWGLARAKEQLQLLCAQGYTGIVIDNLAHLVGFEDAREPIYAADSPARLRAQIYRRAFGELFEAAAALGMEVFVTTDMQWSTPELRAAAGELHPASPRLRELNRQAVQELFGSLPQVSGLVVRVGEAGGAHNQGGDYAGHMIYTTPASLRALIGDLLPLAEAAGRLLIVRTWSVGIGPLGDLVCSPERYREVFGGLDSPNLLVSVKHVGADFFRLLPDNPTLGLPGPRQIVELQNRREYELFGMVPASTAALHGAALARAAADPQCAGVWAWNSTGGWGGGQAALGAGGWNLWTELTSALTAAQAQAPALDAAEFVRAWLSRRTGDAGRATASAWTDAVADLYLESAGLIERGWYLGRLPNAAPCLGRIVLTPLLWVWWTRPTAALPVWAYLAGAAGDPAALLRASAAARDRAAWHAARLAALAPAADPQAAWLVASARYLADALDLAYAMRALMLPLLGKKEQGNRGTKEQRNRGAGPGSRAGEQRNWGTEEQGRAAGQGNKGTKEPGNRGTGPGSRAAGQGNNGTTELGNRAGQPGRGTGPGSRAGEPGRAAGQGNSGTGELGNRGTKEPGRAAGQPGSRAGEQGNRAGQPGSRAAGQGNRGTGPGSRAAGQPGSRAAGQLGSRAGELGRIEGRRARGEERGAMTEGGRTADAAAALRAAVARQRAVWGGRADFPALELGEIERFLERLAHAPRRVALQAHAARALAARLRAAPTPRRGVAGAVSLRLSALAAPLRRRALKVALPWLSRRLDLLPTIFFEAGPAIGEWAS